MNGGTCELGECKCVSGFSGYNCSIDECDFITCFHGGTCSAGVCNCAGTGYTGLSCDVMVDHCALFHESSPCGINGQCQNDLNRNTFKCVCFHGYTGSRCEYKLLINRPTSMTTLSSVVTQGLQEHEKQGLDDRQLQKKQFLEETQRNFQTSNPNEIKTDNPKSNSSQV